MHRLSDILPSGFYCQVQQLRPRLRPSNRWTFRFSVIFLSWEAFFNHTAFTYFAFFTVPAVFWLLNRTPFGLAVKVAGENPMALEAQGIDVLMVRTIAVVLGSALMAVGGAYLTMSAFDAFILAWSMGAAGSLWLW